MNHLLAKFCNEQLVLKYVVHLLHICDNARMPLRPFVYKMHQFQTTLAEATALLSHIESSAHGTISELDSQDSLQEDSEVDELYNDNGEKGGNNEDSEDDSNVTSFQGRRF